MTRSTWNGGWAAKTITLPTSFSVNQTCSPSGEAAILGQNGETWCHAPGDLMSCRVDDNGLRGKARADVAVAAIWGELVQSRPVWNRDTLLLGVKLAVEDCDVVFATDRNPDLAAVLRKEGLVRGTSDVGCVFDPVGGGIDEGHRIRGDRDHR